MLAARPVAETPIGARDQAMLLLGFGAPLRRSELMALTLGDVETVPGRVLLLTIGRSKTDPVGSKRRLFGVQGLAPLRDAVRPPYRLDPNCGPGRPRHEMGENLPDEAPSPLPLAPAPLTAIERRAFDYSALEEAMAHLDAVVRTSRQALRVIAAGAHQSAQTPWNGIRPTAIHCLTVPSRHRPASVIAWSMPSLRRRAIRTCLPP